MRQHQRGLNCEFKRDPADVAAESVARPYDFEKILPLDLIRQHCKIDDVPSVTNELLDLYRRAAVDAAQEYTGLLLSGRKVVTEDVETPIGTSRYGRYREPPTHFKHIMKYAAAEPFLWYYGLHGNRPRKIGVQVGSLEVRLPHDHDAFGLGCCNPCGANPLTKIQYVAGYGCEEEFPAQFALGALKYIAHVIENPGDIVVANNESGRSTAGYRVDQASNPALASGAIEIWRTMLPRAI